MVVMRKVPSSIPRLDDTFCDPRARVHVFTTFLRDFMSYYASILSITSSGKSRERGSGRDGAVGSAVLKRVSFRTLLTIILFQEWTVKIWTT